MNILLTGGSGLLGGALQKALQHENISYFAPTRSLLDITKPATISAFLAKNPVDLILHTAAYTDVDGAESDPDTCFFINKQGTLNLSETGIPIVHISTDYVFSRKKPLLEVSLPAPKSVYGQSKYAAEKALESVKSPWWNIRIGWLYGTEKGFPTWAKKRIREGKPVPAITDQFGRPTHADDLAAWIITHFIHNRPHIGHYHAVPAGKITSWYEVGKTCIPAEKLQKTTLSQLKRPAVRPTNSDLRSTKLPLLPPWEPQLRASAAL